MDKTLRFLVIYSAVVTIAFALTVMSLIRHKTSVIDELNVHRINVLEPDGALRLVISNHAHLPGVIVRGKEQPPQGRPQAGMIFYNDETSEIGGLIFGGRRDEKGIVRDSGGMLSFDRYEANQIVQLMGVDDNEDKMAGLVVSDSPSGRENHRRIWLGRGEDGIATLALLDGQGKKRLVMQVSPDGKAAISALDSKGKVIQSILNTDTP